MSVRIKDSLSGVYPKEKCPKCGIGIFGYPRYKFDADISWNGEEYILWECNICGYTIKTPTADAKVNQ